MNEKSALDEVLENTHQIRARDVARQELIGMRAELTVLRSLVAEHEEMEASCCPEDVGCAEYIARLRKELADMRGNMALADAVFAMQRKDTVSADKLGQEATGRAGTSPALGALIEWLMARADKAEGYSS